MFAKHRFVSLMFVAILKEVGHVSESTAKIVSPSLQQLTETSQLIVVGRVASLNPRLGSLFSVLLLLAVFWTIWHFAKKRLSTHRFPRILVAIFLIFPWNLWDFAHGFTHKGHV